MSIRISSNLDPPYVNHMTSSHFRNSLAKRLMFHLLFPGFNAEIKCAELERKVAE